MNVSHLPHIFTNLEKYRNYASFYKDKTYITVQKTLRPPYFGPRARSCELVWRRMSNVKRWEPF